MRKYTNSIELKSKIKTHEEHGNGTTTQDQLNAMLWFYLIRKASSRQDQSRIHITGFTV